MAYRVYELDIDKDSLASNLKRLQAQIFKLLPMREEGKEWKKPLQTVYLEIIGMRNMFPQIEELLSLSCKLNGLLDNEEVDFQFYRRTIFECCGLIGKLEGQL